MNEQSVADLNQQFAINENHCQVIFKKAKGDITQVEIKNKQASAVISLQGAHVLSWVPTGETDVIWLSPDARFEKARSVRGGIPICWPWFGAHQSQSEFPAHGFARTVIWQVDKVQQLATGETQIVFKFDTRLANDSIKKMWPVATSVEHVITIGKCLSLALITKNNGAENIEIGEALHTYFNVEDVRQTTVQGLHDKNYLDKPDGFKCKKQTGEIKIADEVDRVYLNTMDEVVIDNKKRKIIISKQGSQSTIVWNPWQQTAEKMGDLGVDGYLNMLCVESGNAAENVVDVAPGESHGLRVVYKIINN